MVRILIVEDDDDTRDALCVILKALMGVEADVARDGLAGVARIQGAVQPYDVVLTDERMPGMMGHDLVRWMRQHAPGTPVVLMSAFHYTAADAAKMAPDAYITKPIDAHNLVAQLRRMVVPRTHP